MGSVQQGYVAAEAVIGDILVLATPNPSRREYRALLEVGAINYALKSEGEQEAILAGYRAFLNGLNFPLQLVIQVRPLDLVNYAERIRSSPRRLASVDDSPQPLVQPADHCSVPGEHDLPVCGDAGGQLEHQEQRMQQRQERQRRQGRRQRYEGPSASGQAGAVNDQPDVFLHGMWQRLAEDEAQYILDLAARKTLLERRFYLVLPADEQGTLDAGVMNGSGMRLSRNLLSSLRFAPLPFPGRARRERVVHAHALQQAARVLDLRAQSVMRELSRIGLETRRLAGSELTAVYHRSIAPDAARRFPLSQEHLVVGTGLSLAEPSGNASAQRIGDEAEPTEAPGTAGTPTSVKAADRDVGEPAKSIPERRGIREYGRELTGGRIREQSSNSVKAETGALVIMDGAETAWSDLADVLAPASIELTRDDVRLDDTFCRTLAVVGYPRHVYAGWLERLIDLDEPLDVALHLHPQSTAAMIRQLSHRLVQLHSSRLLDQERGRIGHADLGVAYEDVERTRERLQRGDERIFATSLYLHVRTSAATQGSARQQLEERVARLEQELANQQLIARPVTFEQDLGLLSCLPEGRDRLMRTRLLDTSSLATAFPFLANSLSMSDGILYGVTANGSPVFIDTFSPALENGNKVLFAKSGAGKSYTCKVEALRSLVRGIHVYVVDPEAEYAVLAEAVGGQTVRLAPGAEQHLNPFDLPQSPQPPRVSDPSALSGRTLDGLDGLDGQAEGGTAEETPHGAGDALADKVQSLHALLDLMLADRAPTSTVGLTQREKGLLDRALYEVYRRAGISSDPTTHCRPAPLLRDLYDALESGACGVDETHLADRLHRYVHGSLSRLFAEPTNVALSNRLVVFDVRDMDAELRPLGLFLIADFVWTRIRQTRRPRLFIIDEAWTLMQYQEGGRFLAGLARRARKYYLGLTTITQDAEDFLSSEHGRTVLANSSVQLLMKQDSTTINAVTRAFQLSTSERQFLLGCHKGEGLLFAPGGHVALQIGASPLEHYLATTDPRELAERQAGRMMRRTGSPERVGALSGEPIALHAPPLPPPPPSPRSFSRPDASPDARRRTASERTGASRADSADEMVRLDDQHRPSEDDNTFFTREAGGDVDGNSRDSRGAKREERAR